MEMIEEIGILLNQFLAFIQLADQDDNNFIEQIVRRRRRDILRRLLERHRVVLMRVEENWSVLVKSVSPFILGDYVYNGLPVTDKLMMVVWCLANREAYRVLSRRFAINQGTVHYVVMKTMKVIFNMANRFIRWPRLEDYQELSRNFEIVNTLGALDASEFEIRQPLNQLPSYTSRKRKTTIKLQIVSTRDLEIIDAAVGFPGSLGDGRILRNSPLSQALGVRLGQTDYHILADTAYPLREHIFVPFRNNRDLEDHELAYNRAVKSDRQVVERAFGLLKMNTLIEWSWFVVVGWIDDAPQVDDDDEVDPDYEFDEERETEADVEKRRRIAEEFIF
uniref:DDE Tnp4 domain-containing protein n=1 Tax=Daphnia galeata TaxID=27404 RepID=A0A8J2RDB7_9CRUS|nr:unnamed protein product [Daphnia galeata]